ncbi:MAG: hypothetical protein FWC46_06805, partial [Actinomycetia bacterium]|nr:hypothetical protein [Actinomycetes bacterium]
MTEHPAWLPDAALAPLGRQRVALVAPPGQASAVLGSVEAELRAATASHGGTYRRLDPGATVPPETTVVLRLDPAAGLVPDSFRLSTAHGRAGLTAADPSGLLYGL